jgi:hypothetical protein
MHADRGDGYARSMLAVLVVCAAMGLIAVVLMRAVWNKRPETEPKTTSTGTRPTVEPGETASRGPGPPAGSRPDREQKGQP